MHCKTIGRVSRARENEAGTIPFALRVVPVASAAVQESLRCAHGMSDKQIVYADRPRCLFDLESMLRRVIYIT